MKDGHWTSKFGWLSAAALANDAAPSANAKGLADLAPFFVPTPAAN